MEDRNGCRRLRWIVLVSALSALSPVFQAESAKAQHVVQEAASSILHDLQVIDADEAPSPWRWATWQVGASADHSVELMLLRRYGSHAKPIWASIRANGYAPRISRGKPTLLFLYQMGAEAEELELYGLSLYGRPILLGKSSAAIFVPSFRETYFIESHGLLGQQSKCLFFNAVKSNLVTRDCPR